MNKKPASKAPKKKVAAKKPAKPLHPLMKDGKDWNRELVMDHICDCLASSSKGLGSILAAGYDGHVLPSYSTMMKWMGEDSALSERYAHAKEAQAEVMGEEMAELHNKAWVPVLVDGVPLMDKDGKPLLTVDKASVAAVRLEAENKKWLMGKLRPKKYGDKLELNHSGRIDLSDDQVEARLSALLERAGVGSK